MKFHMKGSGSIIALSSIILVVGLYYAITTSQNARTSGKTQNTASDRYVAEQRAQMALAEGKRYIENLQQTQQPRPTLCSSTNACEAVAGKRVLESTTNITNNTSVDWDKQGNTVSRQLEGPGAANYVIQETSCDSTAKTRTYKIIARGTGSNEDTQAFTEASITTTLAPPPPPPEYETALKILYNSVSGQSAGIRRIMPDNGLVTETINFNLTPQISSSLFPWERLKDAKITEIGIVVGADGWWVSQTQNCPPITQTLTRTATRTVTDTCWYQHIGEAKTISYYCTRGERMDGFYPFDCSRAVKPGTHTLALNIPKQYIDGGCVSNKAIPYYYEEASTCIFFDNYEPSALHFNACTEYKPLPTYIKSSQEPYTEYYTETIPGECPQVYDRFYSYSDLRSIQFTLTNNEISRSTRVLNILKPSNLFSIPISNLLFETPYVPANYQVSFGGTNFPLYFGKNSVSGVTPSELPTFALQDNLVITSPRLNVTANLPHSSTRVGLVYMPNNPYVGIDPNTQNMGIVLKGYLLKQQDFCK